MSIFRVLITGFGPFPGVEQNCSADLAVAVADELNSSPPPRSGQPICADCAVLSVEWHAVSDHLKRLYTTSTPNLAIHFGVCPVVSGLSIERQAHNACALDLDAEGCKPNTPVVQEGMPDVLHTRLPVGDLVAACQTLPTDVSVSDDAGRYLCNAAYYVSLAQAARQTPQSDVLFIHIPAALNIGSSDWPGVVETSVSLVTCAIKHAQRAQR